MCLAAHQRLQEHLARQRMLLLSEASARIGTTADSGRTAQELADIAVPRLADFAAVDLLDAPRHGGEPSSAAPAGPLATTRTAVRSVLNDGPAASAAGTKTSTRPCHRWPGAWPRATAPCTTRPTPTSSSGRGRTRGPPGSWAAERTR
ncbi:hypothetical protein HEP87_64175 [Streptomyces sp. S1D4-11]